MNKQQITAHWKIMADFPSRDGDYVVVFPLRDGGHGDLDVWTFDKGTWEPLMGYTPDGEPSYWIDLPFPK
jgi:hypothetical protein